jgi:three-Cys-motif partner protein
VADQTAYQGREQTLVKHVILRQYLSAWAHKVASFCDTLTYVDCFSGPWNAVSDDLSDASFSIALEELRKARGPMRMLAAKSASVVSSSRRPRLHTRA